MKSVCDVWFVEENVATARTGRRRGRWLRVGVRRWGG